MTKNNVNLNIDYDYLFKLLIIGSGGAGKTNLISRFCLDRFEDTYIPTKEFDFKIKKDVYIGGSLIKLQIWDTFYDRFRMQRVPYRGAHGILIVFDVNDSFEDVPKFYQEIQRYASEYVIVGIVGNKIDIKDMSCNNNSSNNNNIKFIREDALDFATALDIDYHEVSSKFDQNINKCIMDLVYRIYQQKVESVSDPNTNTSNITLNYKRSKKNKNCIIS